MNEQPQETTQVGILCEGTFRAADWDAGPLPKISGRCRVNRSFTPTRVGITEIITATFAGTDRNEALSVEVEDCSDLILISSSEEADNEVPAKTLAAIGGRLHKVRWPPIGKGGHASASFAVERTVLHRIMPAGFSLEDLIDIRVRARLVAFGPVDESPSGIPAHSEQKEGPQ